MTAEERISAFIRLGKHITEVIDFQEINRKGPSGLLQCAIERAAAENPWFTLENQCFMLRQISRYLQADTLQHWLNPYSASLIKRRATKRVAVIMPGNIPLAGFHDFLSVLVSGHAFVGKCSSKDKYLLPALAEILVGEEARFEENISFSEGPIRGFDAVIATGSQQSASQFRKYFSGVPHIIRGNRNGLAILDNRETDQELTTLCSDIFLYFGLGCRSISCLLVPRAYSFTSLLKASLLFDHYREHHGYHNNFMYNHTLSLLSGKKFYENGLVLFRESPELSSPVSVVHYQEYDQPAEIHDFLSLHRDQLQCVISKVAGISGSEKPGNAQQPKISDYADGIDTLDFLFKL